jgi:hypothetical protein
MIIRKNTHAPLRIPYLLIKPRLLAYRIAFTESCRYDVGNDQADINKLFGIGYFPSHHNNSVRVGWNYDIVSGKIQLWAYWYENSIRRYSYLRSVDIGNIYYIKIYIDGEEHTIDASGRRFSVNVKPQVFGYLLRPYFGGNRKAPHDMMIDMEML